MMIYRKSEFLLHPLLDSHVRLRTDLRYAETGFRGKKSNWLRNMSKFRFDVVDQTLKLSSRYAVGEWTLDHLVSRVERQSASWSNNFHSYRRGKLYSNDVDLLITYPHQYVDWVSLLKCAGRPGFVPNQCDRALLTFTCDSSLREGYERGLLDELVKRLQSKGESALRRTVHSARMLSSSRIFHRFHLAITFPSSSRVVPYFNLEQNFFPYGLSRSIFPHFQAPSERYYSTETKVSPIGFNRRELELLGNGFTKLDGEYSIESRFEEMGR